MADWKDYWLATRKEYALVVLTAAQKDTHSDNYWDDSTVVQTGVLTVAQKDDN
jgi:hypothetical protein